MRTLIGITLALPVLVASNAALAQSVSADMKPAPQQPAQVAQVSPTVQAVGSAAAGAARAAPAAGSG
ncbi:MAG: hypothetical protein ACREVD_02590, partial [Burkholderiales bacterium]